MLDIGTPEEIVARRQLRGVELETAEGQRAAELLRQQPEVDEVAHYGDVLRLITRGGADPEAIARRVLTGSLAPRSIRPARVDVEDAFVSMVRAEARRAA